MAIKEENRPKFFPCYGDNEVFMEHLTDEQAGKLWKLLFALHNGKEIPKIEDPTLALAFDVFALQIKRDAEKYSDKVEKNRANASARKRTQANANEGKRGETKGNGGSQEKEEDKQKEKEEKEHKEKQEEEDKEEEEEKKKEKDKAASATTSAARSEVADRAFCENVINMFNAICTSFPKSRKYNRLFKLIEAKADEIDFEELFYRAEASDFLSGRSGDWKASCEWLIENAEKILSGHYDNRDDFQAVLDRELERTG